jgi:hypothetical protein
MSVLLQSFSSAQSRIISQDHEREIIGLNFLEILTLGACQQSAFATAQEAAITPIRHISIFPLLSPPHPLLFSRIIGVIRLHSVLDVLPAA